MSMTFTVTIPAWLPVAYITAGVISWLPLHYLAWRRTTRRQRPFWRSLRERMTEAWWVVPAGVVLWPLGWWESLRFRA